MTDTTTLAPVLAEHIAAVNALDEDAIVTTPHRHPEHPGELLREPGPLKSLR